MTTLREAAQMALEALESKYIVNCGAWRVQQDKAIEALRAVLAQPEPEPVAWMYNGNLHLFDPSDWADGTVTPLYNSPPQREWQNKIASLQAEIKRLHEIITERNHQIGLG